MNTPLSRMSAWDVPHVPSSAPEKPTAEDAPTPLPEESEVSAGESRSPQELPLFPLPREETAPLPADAAQVRFLNAVTEGGGGLRITAGNRLLSSSLSPGALSEYFTVPAGFRAFALHDALHPWVLLFRSTLPLTAGDRVTLALVRSRGGLDLVRVDDRPCGVRGSGHSCVRCVNLAYNSPGLDLVLTDGRVVFTDVRFRETTNYRRAQPGRYDLYAAQTPDSPPLPATDIETVEELPRVLQAHLLPGSGLVEPLASFSLDLRGGEQVSVYLMGDWEASPLLQVKTVENF